MRNFRGILTGAAALVLVAGVASATEIDSVAGTVTFATDGSYTLTLADFNSALGTLTGATLYLFGSESISNLTLTNTAGGAGAAVAANAQTFDLTDQSNLLLNSANTANNADRYTNESLDIFDTGIGPGTATIPNPEAPLTLGGGYSLGTAVVCAQGTPTANCNSVSYTPPPVVDSNTDPVNGFTVGTGIGGVTGVVKDITGADLVNYIVGGPGVGAGTFNLAGTTKNLTTFSGGGGNINLGVNTNATFNAEIDYTYTVPGTTPEPATFALFSGALLAIGLYRKKTVR